MSKTKIEWTDETWNVTGGCTPVSAGCLNCAAARSARRCNGFGNDKYKGLVNGSKWTGEIRLYPDELEKPLHWKQQRRVFVDFMSDLFHESVPFEWIDTVFAVMALCPQHTFQVLTKRPERMAEYLSDIRRVVRIAAAASAGSGMTIDLGLFWGSTDWPLPNVWLGTTTENQEMADERIPHLLKCPAAKRFVSVEPMLGAVDLEDLVVDFYGNAAKIWRCKKCGWTGHRDKLGGGNLGISCPKTGCRSSNGIIGPTENDGLEIIEREPRIDWVICGGESGPGARPMHPDWARSVRDQCKAAGVPLFFKQWGKFGDAPGGVRHSDVCVSPDGYFEVAGKNYVCVGNESEGEWRRAVGKKKAGSLLDGVQHKEMPV